MIFVHLKWTLKYNIVLSVVHIGVHLVQVKIEMPAPYFIEI